MFGEFFCLKESCGNYGEGNNAVNFHLRVLQPFFFFLPFTKGGTANVVKIIQAGAISETTGFTQKMDWL